MGTITKATTRTWLLLAIAIAAAGVAGAADRVVLCEELTNVYCHSCGYAAGAFDRLVDVYPDSFALVQIHVNDAYATAWGDDRWLFYDAQATPTAVFDGTDRVAGAVDDVDQQYTIYRTNHFLPRRAAEAEVTLDLSAEDIGNGEYRITAEAALEPGAAARDVRVWIVQVLDHFPADRTVHRNTFKRAAPPEDARLEPSTPVTVTRTLTFDADSWNQPEDIKIIAWVQAPHGTWPAEVEQAAVLLWPLISLPGDADADGIADGDDTCPARYNPDQADADGDGVGDLCDSCPATPNPDQADRDEDGWGDACDSCPDLHHHVQDDADGDGRGDPCDACPTVPATAGVDGFGRPLGGIDDDCDVDRFDLVRFDACATGPGAGGPPVGCPDADFARADTDGDGDADAHDLVTLSLNLTGPLVSPPLYIGVAGCVDCHQQNHGDWLATPHASAFATLQASGDDDNELCFPCHTVGYGQAGGFVSSNQTPQLADVQCEVCHGPGSNHAADPENVPLTVDLAASLCGACHQSCHGLCGEDHHPQFEQWSVSAHSLSLFDLQMDPSAEDACLECHSTDYRLAAGDPPGLTTAVHDVECVGCHDPHGGPHSGQLRGEVRNLCADCHTMEDAAPGGDGPAQPQAEMLHGVGGVDLGGEPMQGPYSEHWWGIADECAHCHVHFSPYGGPDDPVDSGHDFVADLRACAPCHSVDAATALVAAARAEVEARLAGIAPYLDPSDPLYVDPSTLPPAELARWQRAVFDVALVREDGSFASHNAPYARALLAEAEAFFGIDPWEGGKTP